MSKYKLLIILFAALMILGGCTKNNNDETINSFSDLNRKGIRIGVSVGTPEETSIANDYPDADLRLYTEAFTAYEDLKLGRLDAVVYERNDMELAIKNGITGTRVLDDNYSSNKVVVGLSKISKIKDIRESMNKFIKQLKDDGTLDDMYYRWVYMEDYDMPQIDVPTNSDITLTVGTSGIVMPYSFYIEDKLYGYDIELARRFANYLNANLVFKVYDYGSIITACTNGEVDCIMANLFYTPERAEEIDFSDTVFEVNITAMVKDESAFSTNNFINELVDSFNKTFIRENRWKLFVQGIGITFLISILSIHFGSRAGFIIFMACRNGNRFANGVTKILMWFINGMPTVVFLMVFYYIIFSKAQISGVAVSIVAFSLIFASSVYSMLKAGTKIVNKGQIEAAYALGFSDYQTFFEIVLPQTFPHIAPAYKEAITSLVKATSVVGYVAVQDITKMGDIVRSRTYDAFFPLIAVSIIYFLITAFIIRILKDFEINFNLTKIMNRYLFKDVNKEK